MMEMLQTTFYFHVLDHFLMIIYLKIINDKYLTFAKQLVP